MKRLETPVIILSGAITILLLVGILAAPRRNLAHEKQSYPILEKLEQQLQSSTDGVLAELNGVEQVFWLKDEDLVAPAPNPECYGQAEDPTSLGWLLQEAEPLLNGQKTLFTTGTQVRKGSPVRYYLDSSIFAVTWKEVVDGTVYTFSEVKIAHPSQFRRFLAGGKYGAEALYTTTEMSECVNAVVASSGDYYAYRWLGIVINEGQVYRAKGELLDTCYIDGRGDLLVTKAGEITGKEALEQYVAENNVRFSLSFGPVMIWDEEVCVPWNYNSGEINDEYPRAALCQLGQLHYLLVTANTEGNDTKLLSVQEFAERLQEKGVPKAYALDGGQTAAIVMENTLINAVSYGSQREISDILYFATAVPNG